jgi:hypothetical protein
MSNSFATITKALEQTSQVDRELLKITACQMNLWWHDPIAVELNRRLTGSLLRNISIKHLIKFMYIKDIIEIVYIHSLQHLV